MSKKLKRSAVALVLAATMVFSSQGVLTAFAAGENKTSTAVDVSALGPILDKEETDVANESGNVNDDPLENVCEICGGVDGQHKEGCSANQQPENTCPVCGGVDGQHEEGCSANQQPENTCPVCGGVDGQHTEDCTANQQPDEGDSGETTCPVCGGVDGQHTEDCTANQQPDEGDSGETTCPECGGVDGQHEENCSLAQESDNTPSEEDVAAAKNVSDLIGALPEASTLDPETTDVEVLTAQVKAAREAYDKLTDAQKALVEKAVLDKLVALEGALEGLQQVETVPEESTVAMIGTDEYTSLNDAIKNAASDDTILLTKDCNLSSVTIPADKTITIDGGEQKHKITAENTQIAFLGNLTFKNCELSMTGTPSGADPNWMYLYTGSAGNSSITFIDSTVVIDGSDASKNMTAFYFPEPRCSASHLTLTRSSMTIRNCLGNGISWGGSVTNGYNTITIEESTLNIDGADSATTSGGGGIIGTFDITVTNSNLNVKNCGGYGSNGSHFTITNSDVNFSNNTSHGLSAGNLSIDNSTVTANNNGYCGIVVGETLEISDNSTVTVEGNAFKNDSLKANYAGVRLNGSGESTIDSTSSLSIKNNKNTGLYVRSGDLTVADGANIEIMNNTVGNNIMAGFGGGIYVGYQNLSNSKVVLPADAKIYNNHSINGGDDIYVAEGTSLTFGKVGSDWVLDDTNLPITNWFYDGKKDGEDTNRWSVGNYYEVFTPGAITGLQAIKAAHQYSYNPGTDPTPDPDPDPDRPSRPNRDDDDDWEPLPDAPVKDKPTTEVDVPEETETPTTEQPDKYNPETGDTTTVFAAMALAAVSLGGVVLLGRKKK